jgi:hypothetical protein
MVRRCGRHLATSSCIMERQARPEACSPAGGRARRPPEETPDQRQPPLLPSLTNSEALEAYEINTGCTRYSYKEGWTRASSRGGRWGPADTLPQGATAAIFGSLGFQPPPAFQRTPFVPPEPRRKDTQKSRTARPSVKVGHPFFLHSFGTEGAVDLNGRASAPAWRRPASPCRFWYQAHVKHVVNRPYLV